MAIELKNIDVPLSDNLLLKVAMKKSITRRDFLNGIAYGAGASLFAPSRLFAEGQFTAIDDTPLSAHYPPTLTGMRGSHPGSFEVAHELAWHGKKPSQYQPLNEHYDLVVVGAGMSGLAAAWYYQKQMGPEVKILILDNHDDFGGHAKRNEFHHNGRMLLSLGGAQNIEGLGGYSEEAVSLFADLGIDDDFLDTLDAATPDNFALAFKFESDLGMAMPSPDGHVTINGHWQIMMQGKGNYQQAVRQLPIPAAEQDKLIAFIGGDRDYLDDLSLREKYRYIKSVSYHQFLMERVGLAEETLPILDAWLKILNGLSGWNYSVFEASISGAPGLRSMGWLGKTASSLATALVKYNGIRMFPDGNASVARLLVQKMIPTVAPTMKGVEDVTTARFDYSALDRDNQPTRIRLQSTVVGVREVEGQRVEVDYVQQGKAMRITANHSVLACYNGIIPHLCPQLPEAQKQALSYGVKTPFVYANVVLENGRAFSKLGATFYQCPMDPFQWVSAAPPIATGGYQPPRGPEDPMVIFMMATPVSKPVGDMSGRDMLRLARHNIYATSFETYEQQIRDQLQALLGKHGFNHETDIGAITVNRIPHGYAYSYLQLDDPEWEEGQAPHEIGRAQFGRISIANSDSMATPLMDAATDAAWRAVQEQIANPAGS